MSEKRDEVARSRGWARSGMRSLGVGAERERYLGAMVKK